MSWGILRPVGPLPWSPSLGGPPLSQRSPQTAGHGRPFSQLENAKLCSDQNERAASAAREELNEARMRIEALGYQLSGLQKQVRLSPVQGSGLPGGVARVRWGRPGYCGPSDPPGPALGGPPRRTPLLW